MRTPDDSCKELLKGIVHEPSNRRSQLGDMQSRIQTPRSNKMLCEVFPVTEIWNRANELLLQYCKTKAPPTTRDRMEALIGDMMIAATVLHHKPVLCTKNVRDFEHIEGLQIEMSEYQTEELEDMRESR